MSSSSVGPAIPLNIQFTACNVGLISSARHSSQNRIFLHQRLPKCICFTVMATFTIASGRAYGREIRMERANGVATQLRTDSIQASARVKADARRLFQALISPEYVEAWLTIPGAGGPWIVSPIVSRADLAWECSPANGEPLHIQADFLVARRRRLFIRWKLNRNSQQLENRISMRLIGDFDHTTLSLCHVGFNNHDQLQWHHELWHASLNRLVNLYRNGAHFN